MLSTAVIKPTPEQEAAVEAFVAKEDLKLLAVAGSGKTTTLKLMAEARPRGRFLYLVFNRALREEAERKMPKNLIPSTLHALAYQQVVRPSRAFQDKVGVASGQVRAHHFTEFLGLDTLEAYVAKATLEAFLRSNLLKPNPSMIPERYRTVAERRGQGDKIQEVLKAVEAAWARMQDPSDPFPLSHDGYVKLWAMSSPRLEGWDALLVDEAQDLDPVFVGILEGQNHLQRVYVGDPAQQIYGWRGAVNAMDTLGGRTLTLTWSFRFGAELAEAVNAFMSLVERRSFPGVRGRAPWPTRVGVGVPKPPFALISRTNAGLIQAVLELGLSRVHVVGGVEDLLHLLKDAEVLRLGLPREKPHPDLLPLSTWQDLEVLAEEVGDPMASILLSLAERYDLETLARRVASLQVSREEEAEVVASTTHKAKGREWDRTLIWRDFLPVWDLAVRLRPEARQSLWEEENLVYVALTRGKKEVAIPEDLHLVLLDREESPPARRPGPGDGGGSSRTGEPGPGDVRGPEVPRTPPPRAEEMPLEVYRFLTEVALREDVPKDLRVKGLELSQKVFEILRRAWMQN